MFGFAIMLEMSLNCRLNAHLPPKTVIENTVQHVSDAIIACLQHTAQLLATIALRLVRGSHSDILNGQQLTTI